jgi:hypothetical protein
MNLLIFKPIEEVEERKEREMNEEGISFLAINAENFTKAEMDRFFSSTDWEHIHIKCSSFDDRIPLISDDFELEPKKWFITDMDTLAPELTLFNKANERFMRKLFRSWDKRGKHKGNEFYKILKKMYKEYIAEAAIKDIIE